MDARERALLHQVHPAKLTTDVLSAVIALGLLWRHRLPLALVVMVVPPVVASAVLVKWARLDDLVRTRPGRRMHRMTGVAMGLRVSGMLVMSIGAWQAETAVVAAGAALISAVWIWVLR
jgi:hypothetical protein